MTARLVDVAKAAGVPVNTVSNVVHESPHVHPDTRARVEHAIDEKIMRTKVMRPEIH